MEEGPASKATTDVWAKAGVMIRESAAAGSKHVSTFLTSANGVAVQRRESTDGASLTFGAPGAAPTWVRLVRAGNLFTGTPNLSTSDQITVTD